MQGERRFPGFTIFVKLVLKIVNPIVNLKVIGITIFHGYLWKRSNVLANRFCFKKWKTLPKNESLKQKRFAQEHRAEID